MATTQTTRKNGKAGNVVKNALDAMKGKKAPGKGKAKAKTKAKQPSPVIRKILESLNLLAQPNRRTDPARLAPTPEAMRERSKAARKLDKKLAANPKLVIDFNASNPKGVKANPAYVVAAQRAIKLGYNCEYAHYCGVLKMGGIEPIYGKLHRWTWDGDEMVLNWYEPTIHYPH